MSDVNSYPGDGMGGKMIQTYEPIQGMIICISGGEYVLKADYLAEIGNKNKEIERLKRRIERLYELCEVAHINTE